MKILPRIKFWIKRNKILLILLSLLVYYLCLRPAATDNDDFASSSSPQGSNQPSSHQFASNLDSNSAKKSLLFSSFSSSNLGFKRSKSSEGLSKRTSSSPSLKSRELVTNLNNSISMPPISGKGLTSKQIPHKIWSFWPQNTPPQFIQDCIAGWKRNNPSYKVTLITPGNLKSYIRFRPPHIFEIMNPQDQMAWVRLAILAQEGGIWMDASMIVTRPLHFIHEKQQEFQSEGLLFFMDHFIEEPAHPFFETFMVAAVPGAQFIRMWFKEWNFVISDFDGGDEYFVHLQKTYGVATFRKLIQACDTPSDYIQAIALLKVLRIDGLPYPPGLSAIKSSYGPLAALEAKDWNNWEFVGDFFLPIGETEFTVDNLVPNLIYLTPFQIQIIDWMGFLNSMRVYHQVNHQSFFCIHLQSDPIDCGSKRFFSSEEVCDDASHQK